MIRVLIWNEYRHEKCQPEVAKIYPQGMHAAIGEYLMQDEDIIVKLACLDDPEQGLSEEAQTQYRHFLQLNVRWSASAAESAREWGSSDFTPHTTARCSSG